MKKYGLGIMRCDKMSESQIIEYIQDAYVLGVRYFESASFYLNNKCEEILTKGLEPIPRSDYELCAKLDTIGKAHVNFNRQLKIHNTNYFDTYLIQGINKNRMPIENDIKYLVSQKENGKIKKLGFSFHDTVDTIDKIFNMYNKWDVVQLKINYHDWNINLGLKEVYQYVVDKGIPITVMAPLNGGLLNSAYGMNSIKNEFIPNWNYAQIALRFFNTLPGVDRVLLGASSIKELKEDIDALNSDGFTAGEKALCYVIMDNYRKSHRIDCTGCKYCESICPKHIPISQYFKEFNNVLEKKDYDKYAELIRESYNTSCIGCGECMKKCPQHIDIPFYINRYMYQSRL